MRGPDDKTRLSYWFPLIEAAGLPVPRTVILPKLTDTEEEGLYNLVGDGTPWSAVGDFIRSIAEAATPFGYPFFLRTDYTSAKHSWRDSCFVDSPDTIESHVREIAEYSMMADLMGLPIDRWVVREYLKTVPAFHAFRGMPINEEFRVFVRDGVIEHFQPYWPPETIQRPDVSDWEEQLTLMNTPRDLDRAEIEQLALEVSKVIPGFWSVDCLHVPGRGWFVTDMAEGDKSYRWEAGL